METENKTHFDHKPMLIIISGPSGVGKGVVIDEILKRDNKLGFSVSFTTRLKRTNEFEGKDYTFISRKDFHKMIENNDFLEWAKVHGNYYGTLKYKVQDLLNRKYDVLLDLDVQGAQKVKMMIPDSVLIFLLPPSLTELETRLILRGTDNKIEIDKRLKRAKEELSYFKNYDYWVINHTVEETVLSILNIIKAERNKISRLKGEIYYD